jgi:hypothetical protein
MVVVFAVAAVWSGVAGRRSGPQGSPTVRPPCQDPISRSRLHTDRLDLAPRSFHADPSGTLMQHQAKAIGSGSEGAQNELQDSYSQVSPHHSQRITSLDWIELTLVCARCGSL